MLKKKKTRRFCRRNKDILVEITEIHTEYTLYCKNEAEKSLYSRSLDEVLCIWYRIRVNFITKNLLKIKKKGGGYKIKYLKLDSAYIMLEDSVSL
jgi:hypothetical protein